MPQFVMGARGMPRRYYDYLPEFTIFHQLSTAGAFCLGLSLSLTLGYLVYSLRYGRKAPANPWGGTTLEWVCGSPPRHDNFLVTPAVDVPYCFEKVSYQSPEQGYILSPLQSVSTQH
jgi:cytochrome c oxidase subunit 1